MNTYGRLVVMALLLTSFVQAQTLDAYTLSLNVDSGKTNAKGTLLVQWTAPVNTDSIPFAFVFSNALNKQVGQVKVNNRDARIVVAGNGTEKNGFYVLPSNTITKGSSVAIALSFNTDTIIDPMGMGYLQLVNDWMPTIPAYRNNAFFWREKALKNFSVTLSVPTHYQVAMTGMVQKETQQQDRKTLHATVKEVVQYGICLSDKFLTAETDANGVKIRSVYFAHDAKWGKRLLEMAKDIVLFYQKEIGFYPAEQMTILPGWDRPVGGYPISSNMFVIHRNLDQKGDNFANWITAHELGHFYWGSGYVLSDNTYPGWFGLSMGIYTDWLYSTSKGLDLSVYNFHYRYMAGYLAGYNTTILQPVEDLVKAKFDFNNVIAHGKSFTVLQMLEQVMGKATFLQVFRYFLQHYKGKVVDYAIFKEICEKQSGQQLDWFFQQWYESNKVLDYRINSVATTVAPNNQLQVRCTIRRMGDATMPLEIALKGQEGTVLKTIPGHFTDTTIAFTSTTANAPFDIQLDPNKKLPLLERYQNDSTTLMQLVNFSANNRLQFGVAAQALQSLMKNGTPTAQQYYLYGILLRGAGQYVAAITQFEAGVKLASTGTAPDRCLLELGKTYDLLGNREKAIGYYESGKNKPAIAASATGFLKAPYKEE